MYGQVLIVLFFYFMIIFIIGQRLEKNSIVDVGWGLGFVVIVSFLLIMTRPELRDRGFLLTLLVYIWGLRLSYHIGKRSIGKAEDYRYAAMKKKWADKWPRVQAFFKVYLLQMAVMYIVALPLINGITTSRQNLQFINVMGLLIWFVGFGFEAIGDAQLKAFKKNPENMGKLMDQGLWSLTRHPNYFGDALSWMGLFLISIDQPGKIWTIISPLLMFHLLRNVSGAKLLEKKYVNRPDFEVYKKKVNMFFPWKSS